MAEAGSPGLSWIKGGAHGHLPQHLESCWNQREAGPVIELPYSLVIEATEDPEYFGFYSPELEGFTGIGHSVEDCLYEAKWGMKEHVELLAQQGLPVPPRNSDPKVTIQNSGKQAVAASPGQQ
jgi:predicted RNase H-like HicB family nuclease